MTWPTVSLQSLASPEANSMVDGPFGSDLKTSEYVESGVPLIRIQNVRPNQFLMKDIRYISEQKAKKLARHDYRPGDVVITKLGDPCGVACVVPQQAGNGIVVADIVRFRGDVRRIDHRFLANFVNTPLARQFIDRNAKGTTRQRVNLSNFRNLPVPLPPIDEQRRIAAILDQAEVLRAKRRQALGKLDTLTQSLFLEMFGDPPPGSTEKPLSEVVRNGTIVTYGIVQAGEEFPGGIPYIRTGDIVDGQIIQEGLRRTDPVIAGRFGRSMVEAGDIVMSIRATVGTLAMVPPAISGANLTQGTARISPGKLVNGIYLLHYLRSAKIQNWIQRQVKGATFREITLARLRELPVLIPHQDAQCLFAQHANKIASSLVDLNKSLQHLSSLSDSLQHRAFRGEL